MMTKRDLWSTAIKFLCVTNILSAPFALIYLYRSNEGWVTFGIFGTALCLLIILAKLSDWVAKKIIRNDQGIKITGIAEPAKELFILALRIYGLIFILYGINGLVGILLASTINITAKRAISDGLSLIFGFYLLSGAKHLVKFLFKNPAAPAIEPQLKNNPDEPKEVLNE